MVVLWVFSLENSALISIQESQVPSEPISSSPLLSLVFIYFLSPDWVAQTVVPRAGQSANWPRRRNRVSRRVSTRPEHRLLFWQPQHGRPAAAFHPRRPGVCIAGQAGLVIGPYHHPATPPNPTPEKQTTHFHLPDGILTSLWKSFCGPENNAK